MQMAEGRCGMQAVRTKRMRLSKAPIVLAGSRAARLPKAANTGSLPCYIGYAARLVPSKALPMQSIACFAAAFALMVVGPAAACDLRESYMARLGPADHFNSNGVRLTSAAAIIRQDRANYHQFAKRDAEDEGDRFFSSLENRAILERMLENGQSMPGVLAEIVNGTPLVEVQICRGGRGDFINVFVK